MAAKTESLHTETENSASQILIIHRLWGIIYAVTVKASINTLTLNTWEHDFTVLFLWQISGKKTFKNKDLFWFRVSRDSKHPISNRKVKGAGISCLRYILYHEAPTDWFLALSSFLLFLSLPIKFCCLIIGQSSYLNLPNLKKSFPHMYRDLFPWWFSSLPY